MNNLSGFEQQLVQSWTTLHKKSAIVFLILDYLCTTTAWTEEIEQSIDQRTGGHLSIDQKSLYRSLRRLVDNGLVEYTEVAAPRTGARRKQYAITDSGQRTLTAYRSTALQYIDTL